VHDQRAVYKIGGGKEIGGGSDGGGGLVVAKFTKRNGFLILGGPAKQTWVNVNKDNGKG